MCIKGFQTPDLDKNKEQFRCIRKMDFKQQDDQGSESMMSEITTKSQHFKMQALQGVL